MLGNHKYRTISAKSTTVNAGRLTEWKISTWNTFRVMQIANTTKYRLCIFIIQPSHFLVLMLPFEDCVVLFVFVWDFWLPNDNNLTKWFKNVCVLGTYSWCMLAWDWHQGLYGFVWQTSQDVGSRVQSDHPSSCTRRSNQSLPMGQGVKLRSKFNKNQIKNNCTRRPHHCS